MVVYAIRVRVTGVQFSPPRYDKSGPVAQLVERCIRIAEVRDSNSLRSTTADSSVDFSDFRAKMQDTSVRPPLSQVVTSIACELIKSEGEQSGGGLLLRKGRDCYG